MRETRTREGGLKRQGNFAGVNGQIPTTTKDPIQEKKEKQKNTSENEKNGTQQTNSSVRKGCRKEESSVGRGNATNGARPALGKNESVSGASRKDGRRKQHRVFWQNGWNAGSGLLHQKNRPRIAKQMRWGLGSHNRIQNISPGEHRQEVKKSDIAGRDGKP